MILPVIVRRCLLRAVTERLFALMASLVGERRWGRVPYGAMFAGHQSDRFRALPRRRVHGHLTPVATTFRSRLLGLAGLTREQGGAGLLIPRCAGVHTFGMRFELDLVFLDHDDKVLVIHRGVAPRHLLWHREAAAILEIPSPQGGEFGDPRT